MVELARLGVVAVQRRHLTAAGIGTAIEPGVWPRLVTRIVHALYGTAWRGSIRGLRAGTWARRDTAEEGVQEGLVDKRVLGRGLNVNQIAKVLL